MSGRLVLLRHGQTVANVERRLDTRPPGAALTSLGREQARAFALGAEARPALLVHSAAARASQTAAVIAAELSLPAQEVQGIHEVQVGDLENRNDEDAIAEFTAVYRRWHFGDLSARFPGGESAHDVLARYLPVLDDVRARYLEESTWHGDIVLVSHGAAIRLVAAHLAGIDPGFALRCHLENTQSVVLSAAADGSWACPRWGLQTPPFDTPAQPDPGASMPEAPPMG